MRYRELGRTGIQVSEIGMGMEHFAAHPENIAPAVKLALDSGINYLDVMIWLPEVMDAFGAALEGVRDRVVLACHLGVDQKKGQYSKTREVSEAEPLFHDLLRRLRTDHADILHLTFVDARSDLRVVTAPGGVLDLALRLKQEGKARVLGMSGHDPATALTLVQGGHLGAIMHPVNLSGFADVGRQRLLAECASRGVGVVAMKAFAAGELLRPGGATVAQCLQYVLDQPALATAAIGAKSADELRADLGFLTAPAAERDYSSALKGMQGGIDGMCLYCNHCHPCPEEIDIPRTLRILWGVTWEVTEEMRADYAALPVKASACTECGLCLERCPFGVEVVDKMHKAAEVFGA